MAIPSTPQPSASRPARTASSLVPTRARHITIAFAIALAVVTYVDRIAIAQAQTAISLDLGLSKIQMAWAFSVFGWAYALFEIPGGWLGDRLGPRRVLMRIVIWWSFFTAATGWAWNWTSLLVTRTLFGAGEAGAYPNMTRMFTTWLPGRERERAQSVLWLASRWGGAFTPIMVATLLHYVSWRRAFEMFGVIGVIWAIVFYRWYRDDPAKHPSVNSAELALMPQPESVASVHGAPPWSLMMQRPAMWLLCAQYACLSYGWYFYVTWLPGYLRDTRGTTITMGALLSGLPLLFGGVGCLLSGWLIPKIERATGSIVLARRIVAVIGFIGASASVLYFTTITDPVKAMFVLGMAGLFNDFVMPAAWAGAMDIGGRYAGTVSGAMNMFGNIAGALSPLVVGYLLAWTNQNWTMTFYVSAAIYSLGAVCWLFLDPQTPLEGPVVQRRAA